MDVMKLIPTAGGRGKLLRIVVSNMRHLVPLLDP